jgi:D-sedoheptulose 7-phosphate isomerase
MNRIARYISEVQALIGAMPEQDIRQVIDVILRAWRDGRRIYVMGNGGSAATSSHFACDLGKGTLLPGKPPFKVVPLTDNVPLITAWGNDVSFDEIFARQLDGVIETGDVAIAISTSGNSPNLLKAMPVARAAGAVTVGFIGFDGGRLKEMVDMYVLAPGRHTGQCEDAHHVLQHLICDVIRQELAEEK